MTHYACVFPGQGSQFVGMGKELAESFTVAKEVFQEVDETLHVNISRLMFEGPIETLTLTENTQPALMAVSLAVVRILEKEAQKPLVLFTRYVAGHSLGEYSALAAAGSFTLSDTARLLRIRGEAMQKAVPAGQGGMVAILGANIEEADAIAKEASQEGVCVVANDNAPGQIVLSGTIQAIQRAIEIATSQGKRAIQLPVSAPFHSPLMEPAATIMAQALENVKMYRPAIPLIANVTATPIADPMIIRQQLIQQIAGKVRWHESMLYLKEQGIEHIVEIGAGKVLAGLTKRIDRGFQTTSLQTPQDIEAFVNQLA